MDLQIRPGEAGDLNRLVEIYNYYVTETHITFDTDAFTVGAVRSGSPNSQKQAPIDWFEKDVSAS